MAGGGGGGGDVVPVSPRGERPAAKKRRAAGQSHHQAHPAAAAWLPLDVIVDEIAARSDAATLVRCAATCREARRRIADDPSLLGRLRLRSTERFVLPLLRGHLTGTTTYEGGRWRNTVYLVDTTAADTTRLVKSAAFADTEAWTDAVPVDSRGGLILVRARPATSSQAAHHPWQQQHDDNDDHQLLVVCNPATRRRQDLPPEPEFRPHAGQRSDVHYVLLVGDGDGEGGAAAVGRPFQVLKAKLLLSRRYPPWRRLLVHTFPSEHGAWSPLSEISTPNIHGTYICWASPRKALVVGDVVHWLCLTDTGSHVLMLQLHARGARVSVTALPASFPGGNAPGRRSYLLATDSAGGSPVVLVADAEDKNIRVWEQCKQHTKSKVMWSARPQVVVEREAILGFNGKVKKVILRLDGEAAKMVEKEGWTRTTKCGPDLLWFGERSGAVLLRIHGFLFWLDLHSKKIVRCFSTDRQMSNKVYCPCEVDLSSWVPTFSGAVTL